MKIVEYPTGQVRSWSISTLQKFLECDYRLYLEKVKKLPVPQHPAAKRGEDIHKNAEDYVAGQISELPDTLSNMSDEFEALREYHQELTQRGALSSPEGEWAFTRDWQRREWYGDDVWARFKMDYVGMPLPSMARVIDHKTGRRYPTKHSMQMIYYAIALLMTFEELHTVTTELWYLDMKPGENLIRREYTRGQAMVFYPKMMKLANEMTSVRQFSPKPSKSACKFCPFNNGKDCIFGIN